MKFNAVIAGAGLSGSVSARILAEKGKKVLVVEKKKNIGGNCHDYKNEFGITVHTHGPHIFHTNCKEVWDFLNRFAEFEYYQHRVLSFADGKYIPFPINVKTINELFANDISVDEIKTFLENQVKKSKYNPEIKNFRDAVISQVGEKLYETFFKNYTIKQWGRDPEELSPEIARRIPVRENCDQRYFSDRYQGIPKYGYTRMIENILDHENISVLTGADYFDIKDNFETEITVYTGKLDRFFEYKYGELEYRSLILDFQTYNKKEFQPVATVNYPNDYDWTRITEFKHFLSEKSDHTTVCYEYPCDNGEPYYVVVTPENEQKREKYISGFEEMEKKGVYFIGRLAQYKYFNMDQVVKQAMDKITNLI